MGVLGEFLIISATTLAGFLLSAIPGYPLPGAVSGLILMLLMLLSGIVRLKHISKAAAFLIGFLPLFFVPLIVNLVKETEILKTYGLKLLAVILATTLITMAATGLTAKLLFTLKEKKGGSDD